MKIGRRTFLSGAVALLAASGLRARQDEVFKVMLCNSIPENLKHISQVNEIRSGNGYTSGGTAITGYDLRTSLCSLEPRFAEIVFTASGGRVGPFRYPVFYSTLTGEVFGSLNFGSHVVLQESETFSIRDAETVRMDEFQERRLKNMEQETG